MSNVRVESDAAHFRAFPWCAKLLDDPRFVLRETSSRVPKDSLEDSFMAETLRTNRTIRNYLTLHTRPDPSLDPAIRESFCLMELGDGVNGYPNICHGGFVATMLDEVMGVLLTVNHQDYAERQGREPDAMISQMTAYMNVTYKWPVKTPGVILATAKITKTEPRKWWLEATMEDDERRVLATAEALFVQSRANPRM